MGLLSCRLDPDFFSQVLLVNITSWPFKEPPGGLPTLADRQRTRELGQRNKVGRLDRLAAPGASSLPNAVSNSGWSKLKLIEEEKLFLLKQFFKSPLVEKTEHFLSHPTNLLCFKVRINWQAYNFRRRSFCAREGSAGISQTVITFL